MSDNRELDEIMKPLIEAPREDSKQKAKTLFLKKVEEVREMYERKQRFSFLKNKQLITSFVAGMAAMLILVVGITSAVKPEFLSGTMTSQAEIVRYKMFPAEMRTPDGDYNDKYTSELTLFSHTFNPRDDLMQCDGRRLKINSYPALFSPLGGSYGGDLKTDFGIPNFKTRFPNPSMAYYMTVSGGYFPVPGDQSKAVAKEGIKYIPYDASHFADDEYAVQDETYFGEIVILKAGNEDKLSGKFIPCEGQKLQAAQYPRLFDILGDKNAADPTAFTLPDLRNLSPVAGAKYYMSIAGKDSYSIIVPEGYMKCISCDSIVPKARFCTECGARNN